MRYLKNYITVFALVGLALSTPLFTGCKRVEQPVVKVAPAKKTIEQTQYIIQVDKDGQIISSRECTEQPNAKPLPATERIVYIDAISKEQATKKAEAFVRRTMELRQKAIDATKSVKNKITITITINP